MANRRAAEEAKVADDVRLAEQTRRWDEQAKDMHVPVLDLEVLKAKARQLLAV